MTNQDPMQDNEDQADRQQPTRKPYETPALTMHGTVAQITEALGGANTDGFIGSQIGFGSDRNIKQAFETINPQDILARVLSVPVTAWSYKSDSDTIRHIGPMAQDFAAAFGVGDSDKHIHMVDANGVTMAAIQALYAMIEQRDQQIDGLRQELDELKHKLA